MKKLALSALLLTGLAGGAAALSPMVYAQSPAPAAQEPRRERAQMPLPGERIEARLAYAKAALKITPAQEAQWNALAEIMRKQATEMDQRIRERRATSRDANAPRPNAIERLEQRQQMSARLAAATSDLLNAAKPLYASFTDDQKKVADELLDRAGQRFRHMHREHGSQRGQRGWH